MSDFVDGLQDFNDYLDRKVSVPTQVQVDDQGNTIVKAETTYTVREIICSLLAGNGIKLPNVQICLKVNLARLLPQIPAAYTELREEIQKAMDALDDFIAHTDIENVIGRMNAAIGEFAAVANMINFCGTPVVPRAIPNVLADAFGSFTGRAQSLLDNLGKLVDSEIGGCINSDGSFKADLFTSGLLKDIADDLANIASWPQSTIDNFKNQFAQFTNDMEDLIEFENKFGSGSIESRGGSNFSPTTRVNKKVGMGVDSENMSLNKAQQLAAGLKGAYDQLKDYEVDGAGNNIFHYLLEPELIAKLDGDDSAIANVDNRVPTYDYCGRVTGYTDIPVQADPNTQSQGTTAALPTQPGIANLATAGTVIHPDPASTTNLGDQATTSSSGVGFTDFSVTQNSASGAGTLSYNNSGTFTYTPPDLSSYLTSVPAQSFSSLTGKPTTIAGYGITDATSYNQSLNTSDNVTFNDITATGPVKLATFTTAQRNAISTPQNGDMIYNTDDNKFQGYANGAWVDLH